MSNDQNKTPKSVTLILCAILICAASPERVCIGEACPNYVVLNAGAVLDIGAFALGCKVTTTEPYEVAVGLDGTMATHHADGTWTINWSEVHRVAHLDPKSNVICMSSIMVPLAKLLEASRGKLLEKAK